MEEGMEEHLRGIGEVARRSGLSVSALRWYDENRVLVPAVVDPVTGYRWYTPDQIRNARVVARLRRVGLPVAAIRRVLADPAAAPAVLDAHLVRLEQGLADARRELSAALTLLNPSTPATEEPLVNPAATLLTTTSGALATALRAVRFAAGTDPSDPVLAGVLLDVEPGAASVVATDRYRLAVAPLEGARIEGPAVGALLPAAWVDEVVERLDTAPAGGEAELTVTAGAVAVRLPGSELSCERLDVDYPDYRRLVLDLTPGVPVQPGRLRDELAAADGPGGPREHVRGQDDATRVVALLARRGGDVVALREPADGAVVVDRDYLLEAFEAAGGGDGGQVTLALDGPLHPLVIRTGAGVSLLMPIAPDA
jgi:DNA-binding transcriptional MerR regulator